MNRKETWIGMGVTALAFGLFWHVWNLFAGEIPAIRELTMSVDNIVWALPFTVSHSWSMLVAPLFVLAFSWFLSRAKEVEARGDDDPLFGLIIGLISGLTLGLISGLTEGLFSGLSAGLISGLVLEQLFLFRLNSGLYFLGGYSLAFGFVCGLYWTMPLGIVFGAVVALPTALILIVLTVLILGIKETCRSLSGKKSPPPKQSEQNEAETNKTALAKG